MKEILLITPPFTQLNTPYPATAYLKGFLNTKGIACNQADLGIEVINEIFSVSGLTRVFAEAGKRRGSLSSNARRILAMEKAYLNTISEVIYFLQGRQPTLSRKLCQPEYLPEASRFEQLEELDYAFGHMGIQDRAKYLCTMYLEDLSDLIVEAVDPDFGFSRYAEQLGRSANSFDTLYTRLIGPHTFTDSITLPLLDAMMRRHDPLLVCFSVPFPGNLYSAFRCAGYIKRHFPGTYVAMGGGFPNTELRSLKEPRVFEFFDFITLDDGEKPVELLYNQLNGKKSDFVLKRTFHLKDKEVFYNDLSTDRDYKMADTGTPDYDGLQLDRYISVIEVTNPMHSLWSDGRWNKLTMAHGCYWGKCTFCDTSLDYIRLYEPVSARILVDRMEEMVEKTGERGFHFVDEAAPPALMREVALEILRRGISVSWWTNIRFEKSFTSDLCQLLKASGCIAVSGGLEVASDRLLSVIKKGVTVEQVARVTRNFTESGIMVHAYLMYGYPTQTVQETIDSLEMVRQMFELGILQSAFWHQFALTTHSPIGQSPSDYGIHPRKEEIMFADNDVAFTDRTGIDHDRFGPGLKKSLFNFMHGIGFDFPLQEWFDFKVPRTTISPDYISSSLEEPWQATKDTARICWLGLPFEIGAEDKKKGNLKFEVFSHIDSVQLTMSSEKAGWLLEWLEKCRPQSEIKVTYGELKTDFEKRFEDFGTFWLSKPMGKLRERGLLVL